MATVFFVWEQGGNLGHLSKLRLPIEVALGQGHTVYLAARELTHVPSVLGDLPITCLQAPFKQDPVATDQSAFQSYAHLLAHQCFSNANELHVLVRAWRALFELVRPDLVLFEHSPTALIASCGYRFKKVLVGTGFTIPRLDVPAESTQAASVLGVFPTTPKTQATMDALRLDEARVLAVVNHVLARLGSPAFETLAGIYAQADAQFLMTRPELDHFGERAGRPYLGIEPLKPQAVPRWPAHGGIKVFAYLQLIPSIEPLLKALAAARVCALLVVHGLTPVLRAAYSSDRLQFSDGLVDLGAVALDAAWVINHCNHNTVATFFAAGLPQLLIPIHQEQLFLSLRLAQFGTAVLAFQDQADYTQEIEAMLSDARLPANAGRAKAHVLGRPLTPAWVFIGDTFARLLA